MMAYTTGRIITPLQYEGALLQEGLVRETFPFFFQERDKVFWQLQFWRTEINFESEFGRLSRKYYCLVGWWIAAKVESIGSLSHGSPCHYTQNASNSKWNVWLLVLTIWLLLIEKIATRLMARFKASSLTDELGGCVVKRAHKVWICAFFPNSLWTLATKKFLSSTPPF